MTDNIQKLDRQYQRELLERFAKTYPKPCDMSGFLRAMQKGSAEEDRYAANMKYLEGHGLVESGVVMSGDGGYAFSYPRMTVKGMDFLLDDGGLSAVLGVVTVRLHADTVREILLAKISSSTLSPEEKSGLRGQIQQLPAEGIRHLATRLLDMALDNLPEAVHSIQNFLGSLPTL